MAGRNHNGANAGLPRYSVAQVKPWKGITGPSFRRAFSYLRGHRWLLAVTTAFGLLYLPFAFVEPFLVKFLVDRIMLQHQPDLLVKLAAVMIVFFAVYGVIEFVSMYCVLKLGQRLHATIKSAQLSNLLAKGLNFHRSSANGRLIYCFFNDSNQIGTLLSLGLANTVLSVLFVLMRAGILWYIAPGLLAVYAAVLPLQCVIMYRVMKRVMRYQIELKGMDEDLTSRIESVLAGAVAVKGFGFSSALHAGWDRAFGSRLSLDLRNMIWQRGGHLLVAQLQIVGSFLILFYGVYLVNGFVLTLGDLLAFLAVSGRLTPSVHGLIGFFVGVQETLVGLERYYRIYDLPDEEAEFGRERVPGWLAQELTVSNLAQIAIKNVEVDHGNGRIYIPCDFRMEPGRRYIWHGPNGAGKTSLGLALAGLVPHARGSISCGGTPLSDFSLPSVRNRVLYVTGEPFWPERPLLESFTNPTTNGHVDEKRLAEALEMSEAADIVDSMPLGLRTVLEGNGSMLSKGESQRLFLALALYRRPDVLVLDEVLANVPVSQRSRILERLKRLSPQTTLVYITNTGDDAAQFDGAVQFRRRALGAR